MRNLFSTRIKIILVVALLATVALGILSGITNNTVADIAIQGIMAPLQAAGTALTSTAEKYYDYMFRYEALEAENVVLQERIAQMEDVARQADAVTRENQQLRQALQLKQTNEDYQLVDAYIIGWSSTDWENTLTINRGTNAGLEVNMCAITSTGQVVGLVTAVGWNWAEVKTVLDSTLEISGTISSSGYHGMVRGGSSNNQSLLRMSYLPSSAIIRNQEQVVTSGSTLYPRGLIMGTVVDAGFEETGVAKFALLDPAADISALEMVFIITEYASDNQPEATQPADGASQPTQAPGETTAPTQAPQTQPTQADIVG